MTANSYGEMMYTKIRESKLTRTAYGISALVSLLGFSVQSTDMMLAPLSLTLFLVCIILTGHILDELLSIKTNATKLRAEVSKLRAEW